VNWLAFALFAWVFLGLEKGLKGALEIGPSGIAPSFVFGLLTLVAMSAHPVRVAWAAVLLGVAMDLCFEHPLKDGAGAVTIIGPYAISYLCGCQLIIALRGLMIRRNPLSMGFLAFAGSLVAGIVMLTILWIRTGLGAPIAFSAKSAFIAVLGSTVYTGLVSVLLALALLPFAHLMGLPVQTQRRFGRRG
jgi:hypothetical protein